MFIISFKMGKEILVFVVIEGMKVIEIMIVVMFKLDKILK